MRALLAGELSDGPPGLFDRVAAVTIECGGPRQYQPCFGKGDSLALAGDLAHGLLSRLPSLRQQVDRQQQLAAVAEDEAQP